jgi:prepilin peptidase CpaA
VQAVLIALVLGAAFCDVRYRRIPNWLTVTGVLVGLALNGFLDQGRMGLFVSSLLGLVIAFGVYFALYALHAMGAGDVKLMAAVGAIVGWPDWFGIFIITAIIGGIMALILVIARGRVKKTFWNVAFILSELRGGRPAYLRREELDVKSPKAMRLPHGAVIAVGTLVALAIGAHFSR